MKTANQFMQAIQIRAVEDQFTLHPSRQRPNLPINHALQIKAAEYWLKLGEADQALRELENLPSRIWKCGWCPKGRRAEDGPIDAKYQLQETLTKIREAPMITVFTN